jgi:DNA-binding winged helix-turn-helix (wHTH) protein
LLYLFEDFALDTDRCELRRGGDLAPIEPQVFDLLLYLVLNHDRVVSKDDMIAAVWGGRVVSESALTNRINAARTAIGDSGERQRLIKTLQRKGIRFVGTVLEEQERSAAAAAPVALEQPAPVLPLPDRPSIAVLPFENMSADPEQEYFASGMADEIITALSRCSWLFVIARNSRSHTRARPWTCARSAASSVCAMCWKEACGGPAIEFALARNSPRRRTARTSGRTASRAR